MVPRTTTSRALTEAFTFPLGPTVRRCSWHSTVPSTSPSMVKSSRLKIWPFTITDLPNTAAWPRDSIWGSLDRPGSVDMGMPSFASSDEVGGTDNDFGTNSSSLRRFHIGDASFVYRGIADCFLSYYGDRMPGGEYSLQPVARAARPAEPRVI